MSVRYCSKHDLWLKGKRTFHDFALLYITFSFYCHTLSVIDYMPLWCKYYLLVAKWAHKKNLCIQGTTGEILNGWDENQLQGWEYKGPMCIFRSTLLSISVVKSTRYVHEN